MKGLTNDYICSVINDMQYFTMIINATTFIKKIGWTLNPSQNIENSCLQCMHIVILNLLDHDIDL